MHCKRAIPNMLKGMHSPVFRVVWLLEARCSSVVTFGRVGVSVRTEKTDVFLLVQARFAREKCICFLLLWNTVTSTIQIWAPNYQKPPPLTKRKRWRRSTGRYTAKKCVDQVVPKSSMDDDGHHRATEGVDLPCPPALAESKSIRAFRARVAYHLQRRRAQ